MYVCGWVGGWVEGGCCISGVARCGVCRDRLHAAANPAPPLLGEPNNSKLAEGCWRLGGVHCIGAIPVLSPCGLRRGAGMGGRCQPAICGRGALSRAGARLLRPGLVAAAEPLHGICAAQAAAGDVSAQHASALPHAAARRVECRRCQKRVRNWPGSSIGRATN